MRALLLFIIIGNVLIFGAIGLFVFVPKDVTIVTEPAGASVSYNGAQLCSKTPCDFSLNKVLPKVLIIEHQSYKPYTISLSPLGDGWDAISKNTFKLEPFVDPEDVSRALEACNLEREKGGIIDNVDAQPCYRVPPIMPPRAERSGHCKMVFDISRAGKPLNIRAKSCTGKVFAKPSIAAIEHWVYLPAKENGVFVVRTGVESKMSFKLTNELGTLIPEPETEEVEANRKNDARVD